MSDSVETVEGVVSDSVETVEGGVRFSRDSEMGCQIQ